MKNKRAKIPEGTGQMPLNPIKKNLNLKNREQLRKRLKGLLEKDKNSLHLLASPKPPIPSAPKILNNERKTKSKNVSNKTKEPKANKPKITTSPKQSAKLDAIEGTANSKGKPISASLKRKTKTKIKPAKKTDKLCKIADNSKNIPASNYKKQKSVNPNVVNKDPAKVKQPKKKSSSSKQTSSKIENKLPAAQAKNKTNLVTKQKLKQKENTQKPPKKQKTNVKPYRGPLRPQTSESDSDDSASRNLKRKAKPAKVRKIVNDDRALTRVVHQSESSTDGFYDCDDDHAYDYSSNDDSSEYDNNTDDYTNSSNYNSDSYDDYSMESHDELSYSQEDDSFSENSSYLDSASDETYELPGNVPEDVYIANGTAVKHDLSETNEVVFDSDTSCAQIVEIPSKIITSQRSITSFKTLPATCNGTQNTNHADKSHDSEDSCPELVPIESKSPIHDDTDSDCCSDCMSFSGSDSDAESGGYCEENAYSVEPSQMTPEVFKADKAAKQDPDIDIFHAANSSFHNYTDRSPLDRITNSKGNTTSYKIITTNNKVVDPESKIKVKPATNKTQSDKPLPINASISKKKEAKSFNEITPILTKIESEKPIAEIPSPSVTKQVKATPKKTLQEKSPFRTLFYNAINSNHVIVLVKDPLYIYGTVKLKLIAGSLEIFGYNPKRNETLEIFSPRGYSSLRIEPSKSSDAKPSINEKDLLSLSPYFIQTDLEEVIKKFDSSTDAIVILERNDRSKKVNMLKKYMVEHLFPNMNSFQSDQPFYTSEFLLRCNITLKTDKALIVDPKWRSITLNDNSRVMAIGGKSVGKTTLVRYLINRNLNKYPKILLIDLDIGQPEMFVPQTVSATTLTCPLLGPGYFLNKEPDKAFLVGQTNVVLLPERYIESVQALIEYCKSNKDYDGIPWVVNTMGYNKGFGDELIAVICNLLHPTNVVQLESYKEINNFDVIMSKDNLESLECNIVGDMFRFDDAHKPQHNLSLLQSVIPKDGYYQKEWDMNPRDMRLAMIVSRLSTILTGHAEWLTDIKPFCASAEDLEIVNMGDDQINTEDLLKALVGNLIYLCRKKFDQAIECLGIGIVRGVDYNLKQVYLLPAIPLEVLEKVNCLAICGIPLPSSILINQGPKVKGVASYVYNTVDKTSSMYIKQIYNRPEHFLTGRRKSVAE